MHFARSMNMPVRVNQTGLFQQALIRQQLSWRGMACQLAPLQHKTMIRDILYDIEIVSSGHNRLGTVAPPDQKVYDFALALWIERRNRFIQQQHVRIEHKY